MRREAGREAGMEAGREAERQEQCLLFAIPRTEVIQKLYYLMSLFDRN